MKSKILAAVLLLITAANSVSYSQNFPAIREVSIAASFQQISVDKNFQLVLIQNPNKSSVTIAGDKKNVHDVEVNIINDQLVITSKKKINTGKIIVYVPVKALSLIKLGRGASVSGEGVLKFDDLIVVVNPDSHVDLKALGNIVVKPAEGCEFVYEKDERFKIVYQ